MHNTKVSRYTCYLEEVRWEFEIAQLRESKKVRRYISAVYFIHDAVGGTVADHASPVTHKEVPINFSKTNLNIMQMVQKLQFTAI